MSKGTSTLLFVDTNIFLDFYRTEGTPGLSLLQRLQTVPQHLILTDQVEMEFLKNRQHVILTALQSLRQSSAQVFIPAYLADSKVVAGIHKNEREMKKRVALLKSRLARLLQNPGLYDPVFKIVKAVFSVRSGLNTKFSEHEQNKLFAKAYRRFQKGFPPRKRDDTSLGDAINWEWILHCAEEKASNVVVVSRDGDFGLPFNGKHYLNDWLEQEFRNRVSTRKRATFSTSLADALKMLSVPITPAEEDEERKLISPPLRTIWGRVLERVAQKSAFIATYLCKATPVSFSGTLLTIGFAEEYSDQLELVDNARTRSLLQEILSELGLGKVQTRMIPLSAPDWVDSESGNSASHEISYDDAPF